MKNQPLVTQPLEISKDEVRFYKKEVDASIKRRKDEFDARIGFEELIRYFEALQVASTNDIRQLAIIDEFSPAILSVITSTYYQNPSVTVEAANPAADGFVKPQLMYMIQHPEFVPFRLTDLLKSSLKYGMEHSGMKEEMQLADFDLLLAGFCCVEMNHSRETTKITPPSDVPGIEDKTTAENAATGILDGIKGIVEKVKGAVTGERKSDDEIEAKVAEEGPHEERTDFTDKTYCKRWNPLDILFDARANTFKESRHIIKVIRKTVAEFNEMYPQWKDRVTPGSLDPLPYASHDALRNKKCVTLYEIEIKKRSGRNCVLVLANGLDEAVDYYEKPIVSNNFSIKYSCIDRYGRIYPMSRAKKAKKSQDDINHYMTIQFEHVDRAMRKIACYIEGLSEAGKAAQRSGDIYAIVEKRIPGPVYEAMPAPSVIPENTLIVEKMTESINKAIGTNELQKNAQSNNELLGQDVLQKQSFQVNVSAVQDALQDVADQLLDELKDIQQQLWDGDDYFKITGIRGGDQWYTPDMGPLADIMVGDYMVKTNIVSSARPDPMKDRADALQFAQFVISPPALMFAQMHGKRPTMNILDQVAKVFDHNPEMVYEDIPAPPVQPMGALPEPGMGAPGSPDKIPGAVPPGGPNGPIPMGAVG